MNSDDIKTLEQYEAIRARKDLYLKDPDNLHEQLIDAMGVDYQKYTDDDGVVGLKFTDGHLRQPVFTKPGPSGAFRLLLPFLFTDMYTASDVSDKYGVLMGLGVIINAFSSECGIGIRNDDEYWLCAMSNQKPHYIRVAPYKNEAGLDIWWKIDREIIND